MTGGPYMEPIMPGVLVEVVTGPLDGAIGLLLEVEERDGRRYSTVQMSSGEVVVIETALRAISDDLPRELGS